MEMVTNPNHLTVSVTLSGGRSISMNVLPHEAFIDEQGIVWLLSMRFDDGSVGNFFLLKKDSTEGQVADFFSQHIVPLGLEAAGNKVQEKYERSENLPAINLAVFLANRYGPGVIGKAVSRISDRFFPAQWGYFELATGELVITHPIRLERL